MATPTRALVVISLLIVLSSCTEETDKSSAILQAAAAAGWPPLDRLCGIAGRDEIRLWVLKDSVVIHAAQLLGQTGGGRSYDGELINFVSSSGTGPYVQATYDDRAFSWWAWVNAIASWDQLSPSLVGVGQRSGTDLRIETCSLKQYSEEWYPARSNEPKGYALSGFIIDALDDLGHGTQPSN